MSIEQTTYFSESEQNFNSAKGHTFSDTWELSPSESLKLCYMAFVSQANRGFYPVEFNPMVTKFGEKESTAKLNIEHVDGTDYHSHWLGVQGIGFVLHAYNKAVAQEQEIKELKEQVRAAHQLLAELNDSAGLIGADLRARLENYVYANNISPAGV